MTFKDLFSDRPDAYARYRPTYPPALFAWLAEQVPSTKLAIDVGTGSGQVAVALAEHFDRVLGLDPSEAQLRNARAHPRVEYRVARAEQLAAEDASTDAIFVAQALHWFDHAAFFSEVRRVLAPNGILAVSCYQLTAITPEVDAVVMELYEDHLGPYWEPERKMVETGYRTIAFPFHELDVPLFDMRATWSADDLIGYLGTWSPLKRFRSDRGFDPLEVTIPRLRAAWGGTAERTVVWPFIVRAFRAALATALAACATSEPDVPALVEVETVHGSGIHRVTVRQDGAVVRRSHRFAADTSRTEREQTLTSDQLRAIAEVLRSPVNAEQESVPMEASEFRITARGSPSWSVECHESEVHRCPIPFRKLWQSLDEIIGDLPER